MLIKYNTKELELLARLMRAEATGEGNLGMLMVGNVGINRIIADCLDFKNIRSIPDMIYQTPGGFSGKDSPLFFSNPTTKEKQLAERTIRGETFSLPLMLYGFMLLKRVLFVDQLGMIKN